MLQYFKDVHHLSFTPAGNVHLDEKGKKAGDLKRYDNMKWSDFPKDNMGRIQLPNGILILDIDNAETKLGTTHIDTVTHVDTITIPRLGITLPLGLYTQTSRLGAYHIYYSVTKEQQELIGTKRILKLHGADIDILQNSVVFEWHSFSEHNYLHEGEILPLPEELLNNIIEHLEDSEQQVYTSTQALQLQPNIARYNLVCAYLDDKLTRVTEFNAFINSVVPKQFLIKNKRRYTWKDFTLNYPFINGIAVKLTTTRELDFHEHVVPTLEKIVQHLGKNPQSKRTQFILHKNILQSLPQHPSIRPYDLLDDALSIEEHAATQNTIWPMFRTINTSKRMFIHLDKFTLLPIRQGGAALFDATAARAMHPERNITNEEGRVIGWCEEVPLVEVITDPFKPSYSVDEHSRHVINLSTPSKFIRSAEPHSTTPDDNILLRTVYSVVHPAYRCLVLRYYSEVIFSDRAPTMVLWLATRESVKGGTGKSLVALTILGKILQHQAASISDSVLNSGYSVTEDVRLLSIGEGSTSGKDHARTYQTIKQMKDPSYTKTNEKYGAMSNKVVKANITGSSNQLPRLETTDRRYLCLEPAHTGQSPSTEPLSRKDAIEMAKFETDTSDRYDEVIQAFTNHLYHLYLEPMDDDMEFQLYAEAPETIYRKDWIVGGLTHTKALIYNLNNVEELLSSIHIGRDITGILTDLLSHFIYMYNSDTEKVSLSWKWFADMVPLVANDPNIDLTKSSLSKALGDIDFPAAGQWAIHRQKTSPYIEARDYPQAMYTMAISPAIIEGYKKALRDMTRNTSIEGLDNE